MLTPGGNFQYVIMQEGATSTGNGASMLPTNMSAGVYPILTAQIVGLSGDVITFEGTINETDWDGLPCLRTATREIATTATANGLYQVIVTGLKAVRARVSTYSGGTIYVYGLLTAAGEPGFLAEGGGEGTTDHAALTNLDYASAGHTGFEASGTAAAAISTHVGLSDPHTQYLLESAFVPTGSDTQVLFNDGGAWGTDAGLTYAKATDRLTVAGGLIAPSMRPASDSTLALQLQNAAGTAVVTVDTTNHRFGIGTVPSEALHIRVVNTTAALFEDPFANIVWMNLRSAGINAYFGAIGGLFYWNTTNSASGAFSFDVTNKRFDLDATGGSGVPFSVRKSGEGTYIYTSGISFDRAVYYLSCTGALSLSSVGGLAIDHSSPTARLDIVASTTARASLRVRAGTAPTSPNDGDAWNDGNACALMVNGTNAVNTDGGLSIWMQSSTTARNVGRLLWQYTDKTDATRISEGSLTAFYQSTERKAMRWSADSGGPTLAFYNGTPVAKAAAYTQTFSTADRTLSAYTADNESGAYSGIDNLQVGSVYAQLADLNNLRTAYENLRAFVEDIAGMLNSTVDDLQALNLVG